MPHTRFKLSNARTRQEDIVLLHRAGKQIDHAIRFLLPSLVEVLASFELDALTTDLHAAKSKIESRMDEHLKFYRKPDYDRRRREHTSKRQWKLEIGK
jgi:hypothetical protein